MTSSDPIVRVLLVDDHPIVRYGFARLLGAEPDMLVCAEAVDARTAFEALAKEPDIAVVDITLGSESGIDLIKQLVERAPSVRVLVVSIHDELLYAERALRAGAAGYVMKHEATDKIVHAIRTVAGGKTFVSDKVAEHLVQRVAAGGASAKGSPLDGLTDRELHVLQLLGRGLGSRAIAAELHVSVKTVETYRARLKQKMNLRSSNELVRFAVRWAEQQKP